METFENGDLDVALTRFDELTRAQSGSSPA